MNYFTIVSPSYIAVMKFNKNYSFRFGDVSICDASLSSKD